MFQEYFQSLPLWRFEGLSAHEDIGHFVSTRLGGFSKKPYASLNLGFHVGDDPANVLENRRLLCSSLGIALDSVTTAKQVHDGNVKVVGIKERGCGASDQETAITASDGLVTNASNICLMVLLADCVPMLFFDPRKQVIGVVHAGWRGTLQSVASNTIRAFNHTFGCIVGDILVGIGPSIGPCHYEVGSEVIEQVERVMGTKEGYVKNEDGDGKGYFDLWEANKAQLLSEGVPEGNIEVAGICTYCNANTFFSERFQGRPTGRFGAGIWLKDKQS